MSKATVRITVQVLEFCQNYGIEYQRVDIESAVLQIFQRASLIGLVNYNVDGVNHDNTWDTLMHHSYDMVPTEWSLTDVRP